MNTTPTKKTTGLKAVDAIKHDATRAMIPTSELAGEEKTTVDENIETYGTSKAYATFKNSIERGSDPELWWLGKDKDLDDNAYMKVDTRSLYVHEDIRPEQLASKLYKIRLERKDGNAFALFDDPVYGDNVSDDEWNRPGLYYQHQNGWKNRMIQGDSLLVMNSLVSREGMAGKVQVIYIDPPYGIKYNSNWQMKLNSTEVKDGADNNLSGEPETIKAFRDTWELGIHSYLSYLRDRLVLSRELLTQTGSCFVQISDENVHLVRCLMDEVFGSENFVSQIIYTKTSGFTANTIGNVADYILWYAKDVGGVKINKLYTEQDFNIDGYMFNKIELANGTRMTIKEWEQENNQKFVYKNRPEGSRCFRIGDMCSQGASSNPQPFEMDGKVYLPSNGRHWKANYPAGMKRLKELKRIIPTKGNLNYCRYFDDFPYKEVNNIWTDTGTGGFTEDKVYVVQTSTKAIQRCMLMTTDPGDLVLDPTCGSGTTAYVAEHWGRRWITVDTSRIALHIAKRRLALASFPYYKLSDPGGNIRQGFVYKLVPHVTLKSLANNEQPEMETLYDQPETESGKMRVSGPFTVDTLQSKNAMPPTGLQKPSEAEENRLFYQKLFNDLETNGIRNGDKQQAAKFHQMEILPDPYLNASGYYTDENGNERKVYFHIGPKFGAVSKAAVNGAMKAFRDKGLVQESGWLVLLGFAFEDNVQGNRELGGYVVTKARMHDDLLQDGLAKNDKNAGSFITIGEPDVELVYDNDLQCHIEILGMDIYDPIKDEVRSRSRKDIAYWEIDDDYDGKQFIVRGLHFSGGNADEYDAWRKGLQNIVPKQKKNAEQTLRVEFPEEQWQVLYGYSSAPIPRTPGRKIAVRVISQFGEESSVIKEIE